MRTAMLAIAMAACGGSTEQPAPDAIDAWIDRPVCERYVCFDDTVWKLQPQPVDDQAFCPPPDYNGVVEYSHCEFGCRDNATTQDPNRCLPPPPAPFVCDAVGSCPSGAQSPCTEEMDCDRTVMFGLCTCTNAAWACAPVCFDGLCGAAALQAAIVGTWTGTVMKTTNIPATFPNVTLAIAGDGDWQLSGSDELRGMWGSSTEPGTVIYVQGQTETGGVGTMRMQGGYTNAVLHDLRVQGDRLTATLEMNCLHTYVLDLQRVQ